MKQGQRSLGFCLICVALLFTPSTRAGESVVYSITTRDPNSHLPIEKTEIFAIDLETGKRRTLFSDDLTAGFLLLPSGKMKGEIATADGRLFSVGIELSRDPAGGYSFQGPEAIYELSTDGSGSKRKVLGVDPSKMRGWFLNATGARIGHIEQADGKYYLVVHDSASGRLVSRTEFHYGAPSMPSSPHGSMEAVTWMPDDKRVLFTVALGGDSNEAPPTESSPIGTYVINEDTKTADQLAPEAALHPDDVNEKKSATEAPAVLIGVLPNGRYLACDRLTLAPDGAKPRLYSLDLATRTQRIFPLNVDGQPGSFHLSPSGSKLVFMTTQRKYEKQQKVSIEEVWVLDLASSKPFRLATFTVTDDKPPVMNLIGWTD
jgi:hypothetical protein